MKLLKVQFAIVIGLSLLGSINMKDYDRRSDVCGRMDYFVRGTDELTIATSIRV